jgi:ribosomal protein L7/L12
MNASKKMLASLALSAALLSGCASQVTEQSQFSGFLANYQGLQEVTTPSGQKALRWVADGFDPAAFDTVVFQGLQQYPAPRPDERVNMQTLNELQRFTSDNVSAVLSEGFTVVPSVQAAPAGSRILILNAAMTGVSASNEGMKWYEVVPVAAVAGAASVAAGTRDQDTALFIEADMVDAASGLPVLKVVRKVMGKTLENDKQAITADDFKDSIKGLTTDMHALLK